MIRIMLVSTEYESLSGLASGLEKYENIELSHVHLGGTALDLVRDKSVDIAIADENIADMTGLQFIERLVMINPLINCAAVSSLSPDDFHEASEGFGVFMHLPVNPVEKDADALMALLNKITTLMSN